MPSQRLKDLNKLKWEQLKKQGEVPPKDEQESQFRRWQAHSPEEAERLKEKNV